ncbi:hypothetical protein [Natrinema sp. DC36]|uniref:hypothetical protein n=1 Tax=Natrinema sp. DC36 TaxID=2878680 RepID=UPI001CEFF2D8|nr:hypothetical protein [Natrinema sp. DC36]
MNIVTNGVSVYHEGNQIGRCARDLHASGRKGVFVWYNEGLRRARKGKWTMDVSVEKKISVSIKTILVADASRHAVYAIDREEFVKSSTTKGRRKQYVAKESDDFVEKVSDNPNDILNGNLWIESGNRPDTHYHVKANEA